MEPQTLRKAPQLAPIPPACCVGVADSIFVNDGKLMVNNQISNLLVALKEASWLRDAGLGDRILGEQHTEG